MHFLTVLYSRAMGLLSRIMLKFISLSSPLIYSGAGSYATLCSAIARFGHKKVLVVTDKMLVELGLVGQVVAELEKQGIQTEIYDAVLPDPDFSQVENGIKHCLQHSCDAVLAIGGGSSLDAAKVIAICSGSDQAPRDILGYFSVSSRGFPIYCIPTTAGTGSEATMVSVITDAEARTKCFIVDPKLVPNAVALDPSLMTGLPPAITAATGMDALTHAIESSLSREASDDTQTKALTAVGMIFGNLETAVKDGSNLEAREAMAVASFYAGAAFTITNVGYVHGLAHQLGAICHLPHGLANALFLPHILEFYIDKAAPQMARIAKAAGVGSDSDSDAQRARALVDAVRQLEANIGIPQYADALKPEMVEELVDRALHESHGLYGYPVPKYMRRAECEEIVRRLLPA
ncbi:iron-containing alcohol dehydrogenase [Litorivivens sp.]|uniref:iron-containing alcohol dehydrogenase n=1 Tax=Litorivivens sp. TaxID=2020868 RepID=UPI003564CB72